MTESLYDNPTILSSFYAAIFDGETSVQNLPGMERHLENFIA